MVKEKKFYDILGVSPDADPEALKKAYRKKAVACHPDREQDPEKKLQCEEKFKELSRAYEVLSEPKMRERYDRMGEQGLDDSGESHMDASDIFSSLFGMGGGRGGGRRKERKPKQILYTLEVGLDELYKGRTRKLRITRQRYCTTCKGSGASKPGVSVQCSGCDGKGFRVVVQQLAPGFMQQMQAVCPQCRGQGSDIKEEDKCKSCKGAQCIQDPKVFECHVEPGMADGDIIPFVGEGDEAPGADVAGDVIIVIKEKQHPVFTRKGRLLLITHTLSLADALCGFEISVAHLDGRKILIKNTEGQVVQPKSMYTVSREGMPVKGTGGSEKGDLVIKVDVVFPSSLKDAQRKQLREVLGPKTPAPPLGDGEDYYETNMTETTMSIEQLAGPGDDNDGDEDGPPGGQRVQCAQQ